MVLWVRCCTVGPRLSRYCINCYEGCDSALLALSLTINKLYLGGGACAHDLLLTWRDIVKPVLFLSVLLDVSL